MTSSIPETTRRSGLSISGANLAIFAVAIFPLFVTDVIPTIDLYNHIGRYYVLAHRHGDQMLQADYLSKWGILPNIGMDVIGSFLMRFMEPVSAAKLIIISIFFIQYFGVLFFHKRLGGRPTVLVPLLTVPLLYSFIFTWGFANFLLGLGLVFWAAGMRLRPGHNSLGGVTLGCVMATAIFLTHGVAFALYGLLAGTLEIAAFLADPQRRLAALIHSLALLALQAVAPVALFAASNTSRASGGVTNAGASIRHLAAKGELGARLHELFLYRMTTILRVAQSPSFWFDAITFSIAGAVLLILAWKGRLRFAPNARLAIALGVVLVAIMPPTLFGVGYIADRMPLFLAFLAVAALCVELRSERLDRVCVAILTFLMVARIGFLGVSWHRNSGDFRDFKTIAGVIPKEQVVGFVDAANTLRLGSRPRCDMYGPLLVAVAHEATPLFAFATQQPIELSGRLAVAQRGLPPVDADRRKRGFAEQRIDDMIAGGKFDYVLVCDAYRLRRPFPANGRVVAAEGRFTLLRNDRGVAG